MTFFCLFACLEIQGNGECVSVLHEFGADLEWRTAPDNAVLPNATPLHLAAHYGRVDAARMLLVCLHARFWCVCTHATGVFARCYWCVFTHVSVAQHTFCTA